MQIATEIVTRARDAGFARDPGRRPRPGRQPGPAHMLWGRKILRPHEMAAGRRPFTATRSDLIFLTG
jgi:hypothetical protein